MVRLREIPRTAAFAWSPGASSSQIVTGTKAGAVDADFSNDTSLEVWDLDFTNTNAGVELQPAGSLNVDSRFYAIAWSEPTQTHKSGIIAGALESGSLSLWDAGKLVSDPSNSSISQSSKHTGGIKTVQFNPHRDDLLASAGVKGELYLTNLTDPSNPSRLGTSVARADDYDALDWNKKVPHILVTGSAGGFATVWDVRAKKESINLNNNGRKPVSAIAWDPTTPTKLATATSYDQDPLVLMWDLRNSNAPEKVLKQHDQGILSLSWSQWDPRLLLSCGKDNRTVCWNTQTGEAFGEYPIVTNWTFQTSWNPRQPGLLATASFDGKIAVQTIQNTNPDTAATAASGQALDGADFFASAGSHPQGASFSLPIAPTWLQRPVSATFGFGGKLVRISKPDAASTASKLSISTFLSDPAVGEASDKFEQVLQQGDLKSFTESKISESKTEEEKADWTVIETLVSGSRIKLKEYLGFVEEEAQTNGTISEPRASTKAPADDASFFDNADNDDGFLSDFAASKGAKTNNPFHVYTGSESQHDKQITQALLLGQFDKALDICLKEERMSDAFMIAICGGEKSIEKAKAAYFKQVSKGPNYIRLLASFANKNLWDVVYNADLKEWKQVMAAICTYATKEDFSDLCEALGDRLDESSSGQTSAARKDASFCYLAGSNLEKVVEIWLQELQETEKATIQEGDESSSFFSIHANSLQQFIEKVTVFRQVTAFQDADHHKTEEWKLAPLYAKYAEYADILASQGQLKSAERYIDLLPAQYPAAEAARNRVKQATRKQTGAETRTTAGTQRAQRVVPSFQPQQPSIPAAASTNNFYTPAGAPVPPPPGAPVSSFTPAVPAASSRNAYTPAGYQAPQQGFQQSYSAPYGGFGATPPPPPMAASAQPPAITPAAKLNNLQMWNDTPDFGPKSIPRRSTPGINPSPVNPYAAPNVLSPPQGNAYGVPPKASTPVAPPPKVGAPRVTSPPQPLAPPPSAVDHRPSSAANTYAPPAGFAPPQTSNIQRGASPYNPPPASGAPSGRYAPTPGSQPSGPSQYAPPSAQHSVPPPGQYGAPPPGQYGAPPRTTASPYAPRTSSYGAAPPQSTGPPPSGPPKAAANAPPPAPPPKGPATSRIQPPPPSGTSRNVNTLPSPQPSTSRPGSSGSNRPQASAPSYPSGDRSHISPTAMPVFEILNIEMSRIKSKAPAAYKQQVLDTEKRLDILFDHLNNGDLLRPDTIEQLKDIAQNIQGRQHDSALTSLTELMKTKSDEGSNWIVGVKRLIMMSKATPV